VCGRLALIHPYLTREDTVTVGTSEPFLFDEQEHEIYDEATGPTSWTRHPYNYEWTGDMEVER
jgi:hypothetical protein